MKYLRFQLPDGSFASEVFTSEGGFIGGDDPQVEEAAILSHRAALEAVYGVALEPVVGDADPWDGSTVLTESPAAIRKREAAVRQAAIDAYEAQVQAELRAVAEERLAAKGIVSTIGIP